MEVRLNEAAVTDVVQDTVIEWLGDDGVYELISEGKLDPLAKQLNLSLTDLVDPSLLRQLLVQSMEGAP
tara:strand:- start:1186 stop:1392 length:207 start_codon:yes stop_codon:yes gene_type:complete